MCNKPLEKVAYWVAGKPIGPTCYVKRFGNSPKIASRVTANDQDDLFNQGEKMSYAEFENKVIIWGTDRGIVQNSNPMAQAIKTLEEVTELMEAINKGDRDAQVDAYGDILVTLIMGCATVDIDLTTCLEAAYNQIKNRKGHLDAQGVFHKEQETVNTADMFGIPGTQEALI